MWCRWTQRKMTISNTPVNMRILGAKCIFILLSLFVVLFTWYVQRSIHPYSLFVSCLFFWSQADRVPLTIFNCRQLWCFINSRFIIKVDRIARQVHSVIGSCVYHSLIKIQVMRLTYITTAVIRECLPTNFILLKLIISTLTSDELLFLRFLQVYTNLVAALLIVK